MTEFNGCSLSTLSKSVVAVEPEGKEADALRAWWRAEGQEKGAAGFVPVGQDGGRGR